MLPTIDSNIARWASSPGDGGFAADGPLGAADPAGAGVAGLLAGLVRLAKKLLTIGLGVGFAGVPADVVGVGAVLEPEPGAVSAGAGVGGGAGAGEGVGAVAAEPAPGLVPASCSAIDFGALALSFATSAGNFRATAPPRSCSAPVSLPSRPNTDRNSRLSA